MNQNIQTVREILKKNQKNRKQEDIKIISSFVSHIKFFESLKENKSIFKECCTCLNYEYYSKDTYIFKEGEYGDKFFIIIKGEVSVIVNIKNKDHLVPTEVLVYKDGDSFGELALIEKHPRAASIFTKTECHVAVLEKNDYNRILANLMKKRRNELIDFLKKQAIFRNWTKGSLLKISYCFYEKKYTKDKIIFFEGQKIEFLYLIKEGEVKLMKKIKVDLIDANETMTKKTVYLKKFYSHKADIGLLSAGELLGVYDIDNNAYSATCKCVSTVLNLLVISLQDFKKRVNNEDSINFLNTGKLLKDSIHEDSIKSIKKVLFERVSTPYKKIFTDEVLNLKSPANNFKTFDASILKKNRVKVSRHKGKTSKSFFNQDKDFRYSTFDDTFPNSRKKENCNVFNEFVTQNITTKQRLFKEQRPSSSYSKAEGLLKTRIKRNNGSIQITSSSAKNETENLSTVYTKNKNDNKTTLLFSHLQPFGRIKLKKKTESKEDPIVNIHTYRKNLRSKTGNPVNLSFRSINLSPKKSCLH